MAGPPVRGGAPFASGSHNKPSAFGFGTLPAVGFVLSSGVLRFAPAGRTDPLRSLRSLRPEALQVGCRPALGVIRGFAANAANRLTLCAIGAARCAQ